MDVRITNKNGESFTLEEYGITVKDFIVSSIEILTDYGTVDGRHGTVDRGSIYGSRTITVPFIMHSRDLHDFPLKRDKIFDLVLSTRSFYIQEMRRANYLSYDFVQPGEGAKQSEGTKNKLIGGKRYLVRLQNVFEIEQMILDGQGEFIFETTDLPFAESVRTTLEGVTSTALLGSGHDFNSGDYYVMIDDGKISLWNNVDDVDYYFITHSQVIEGSNEFVEGVYGRNLISHDAQNWERGVIYTNDSKAYRSNALRMSKFVNIKPNTDYTITNYTDSSEMLRTRVYDAKGNIIEGENINVEPGTSETFTSHKNAGKMKVYFNFDFDVSPKDVGLKYFVKLEEGSKATEWTKPPEDFSFKEAEESQARAYIISKEEYDAIRTGQMPYEQVLEDYPYDELVGYTFTLTSDDEINIVNLGNVDIHPFQQYLRIVIENVQGTQGAFRLVNLTNNTEFSFLGGLRSSDVIVINGPRVRFNNNEAFRRTRRTYIQMSSGDNRFAIEGADSADVTFDFRFYYK